MSLFVHEQNAIARVTQFMSEMSPINTIQEPREEVIKQQSQDI